MSFNFTMRCFPRRFYLPTFCLMCSRTAAQCALKACTGCRLISYCSTSCQRRHWPDHKPLCQAARAVTSKTETDFLFQHAFESVTLFKHYRDIILIALVEELGRPLDYFEEEMIFFPNCCTVCYRYEKSMLTCSKCSYVWYCSEQHKELDADAHSKLCQDLSNLLKFNLCYIARMGKKITEGYCITTNKFPECLQSFMNDSVHLMDGSTFLGKDLCRMHASESFSFPMTAVYALKQFGKTVGRDLVVHVVGAQDIETIDINLWRCLEIILPTDFDNVSIVLVGPELNMEFFSSSETDNTCNKFKYEASENFYHTFYQEQNVESRPADLIIAFNCGFHAGMSSDEPDSWKDTIPYFCKHANTLIVFTSYSEKEAKDDLDFFFENCDGRELEILVKHEQNPFSSLKAGYLVWESREDALYYANNYITILKPR